MKPTETQEKNNFGALVADTRSSEEIEKNKAVINRRIAKMNGTAKQCDICEEYFLPEELKEYDNGEDTYDNVCPSCRDTVECEICNKRFYKDELHSLVNINGETNYEHVCDGCEEIYRSEDEPVATVLYGNDEYPNTIGEYHDDTEGDFRAVYHRTDGWRGYYDIEPSDNWEAAHSDCILAWSRDAENLEKFDELFRNALDNFGIKYARVFSRTSNVFSQGYDFFVEKGKGDAVEAIHVLLAARFRDPETFRATALTGKDPEDFDEHDALFVKASKLLAEGMDPEQAVEHVFAEMK